MDAPQWMGDDDRDALSARICDRCDERDAVRLSGEDYVCASCDEARDNSEPSDEDGEAFRGREASAFWAERQAKARRLK